MQGFPTAICSSPWTNSLSREHHPCLGQSKVSNVSDNMNYVSDNMNYLTTHGILHHVLENQSFITSHLCLYCPINFMVFRSKEHHVSQHMVRVSQNMVKYAMWWWGSSCCLRHSSCCLRHLILLIARDKDDVPWIMSSSMLWSILLYASYH